MIRVTCYSLHLLLLVTNNLFPLDPLISSSSTAIDCICGSDLSNNNDYCWYRNSYLHNWSILSTLKRIFVASRPMFQSTQFFDMIFRIAHIEVHIRHRRYRIG